MLGWAGSTFDYPTLRIPHRMVNRKARGWVLYSLHYTRRRSGTWRSVMPRSRPFTIRLSEEVGGWSVRIGTGLDLWEEIDKALKENAREPQEASG